MQIKLHGDVYSLCMKSQDDVYRIITSLQEANSNVYTLQHTLRGYSSFYCGKRMMTYIRTMTAYNGIGEKRTIPHMRITSKRLLTYSQKTYNAASTQNHFMHNDAY